MTFDIDVQIFYGYQVKLTQCFDKNIVNKQVIDEDDWQFINMDEDLDVLIDKHVTSDTLKKFLKEGLWKLYFVCSTQSHSNIDPEESYIIIYNQRQNVTTGSAQDYVTQLIDTPPLFDNDYMDGIIHELFDDPDIPYASYCTVECSW